MGNVWRPNTIKHCLVTKHANVVVSGQTVKTCLIKLVVRMTASNMFDTRLSKPTKHRPSNTRTKEMFKFLMECLMALKFYQTRPNTIKNIQTQSNSTKQGVQTVK